MTESQALLPEPGKLSLPGFVVTAGSRRLSQERLCPLLDALPAGSNRAGHDHHEASVASADSDSHVGEGLLVSCVGRPYWGDQQRQSLLESRGAAASIAHAYRTLGTDLLDDLCGDFSLVVHDAAKNLLLCAVDRFARQPLYWQGDADGVVVAGSADAVLAHPGLERALSPQGLFHYLFFHMVPGPASIYAGIGKLPAAHRLIWRQGGEPEVSCYWTPDFHRDGTDPEVLRDGVLGALRSAIARDDSGDSTGAFLSGGLDSSTVSGVLAERRAGADTYSIGFDAEGYDETAYARIAAEHFSTRGHEYYVSPDDVVAALPMVAAAYDEPFGNSSALPALFCASLARADGKTRLLAGDGGDELYAGNARYAKQQVFEIYQGLPSPLRGLLRAGTGIIPRGMPLLSKARSYVEQASVTLPRRLQSYNYVYRLGLENMLNADFAAQIDPDLPNALETAIYERPQQADTLDRMLYLDWHHTLADNDLRKVGRMCALAGIEVAYPMLDEAVVANSLQVPSRMKLPAGRLRHFYKQATRDFLPDAILNKPKHGFGLPFGIWLAEHRGLHEMANDNLLRLRERGIIQPAFIDRVLSLHQESHAAYYGEFVWVMMMLELWLNSRGL